MSLCNVTILEGGECVKGFPTHEVRKNPISMSTDESIGITFAVWAIIPRGGNSYTKTPHGMFCLSGK